MSGDGDEIDRATEGDRAVLEGVGATENLGVLDRSEIEVLQDRFAIAPGSG